MWMVGGYNETSHHHHHHQVNLDGFTGGRKLRPLIPRPPAAVPSSAATNHSCNFGLYAGSHLFAGSVGGEQGLFSHRNVNINNTNKEEASSNNGGDLGQQGVMSSSRWNPTAEQLRMLEDLYRRGTRTPSTDQIQRITAQLCHYGKIEGKNVFYWFQNHKARERQKRRRELQLVSSNHPHHHDDADADDGPIIPRKERGAASGKQCFGAEQTRSHYASAPAEESGIMSMQRALVAEKAGGRAEHCRSRHNNNKINSSGACLFQLDNERNSTWHNLAPTSFISRIITPPPPPPLPDTDGYATPKTRRFTASLTESNPKSDNSGELYEDEDEGDDDSATLQLFPLRSQQAQERDQHKSKDRDVHFFEFLPPKIH